MTRRACGWAACLLGGSVGFGSLAVWLLSSGRGTWLLSLLQSTDVIWETPPAFGAFHLVWLAICVSLSLLFGVAGASKKATCSTDRLTFGLGLCFFLLETYKQLYSYFVIQDRVFDFGFFPFQFCSLPLYLCLLVPFLPEGRIKETFYKFLALFGTMGGSIVMGYPLFYERVALCVHTMLWHTLMIALGVYLLFAKGYGKHWGREVLPASIPFLACFGLATLFNVCLTPYVSKSPNPLNLYYMSPYVKTHYWILSDVWDALGFVPALVAYALLFIFVGATLIFFATWFLRLVSNRMKNIWIKNRKK